MAIVPSQTDSFSKLPSEVISYALHFVPNKTLFPLRTVNKRIHDIIEKYCEEKIQNWSKLFLNFPFSKVFKFKLANLKILPNPPMKNFTKFFDVITMNIAHSYRSDWVSSKSSDLATRSQETIERFFETTNNHSLDLELIHFVGNSIASLPEMGILYHNLMIRKLSTEDTAKEIRKWMHDNQEALASITSLDFSQKDDLRKLPPEIKYFKNLQELNLTNNAIEELPKEISKLKQLRILRLRNNQLERIPDSISKLSQLIELDLSNNQLHSLPASFCKMPSLRYLSLENNRLTTLPKNWDQLSNLKLLNLSKNKLFKIPNSLAQNTSLEILIIESNPISSIPTGWKQLKCLSIDEKQMKFSDSWQPKTCKIHVYKKEGKDLVNFKPIYVSQYQVFNKSFLKNHLRSYDLDRIDLQTQYNRLIERLENGVIQQPNALAINFKTPQEKLVSFLMHPHIATACQLSITFLFGLVSLMTFAYILNQQLNK